MNAPDDLFCGLLVAAGFLAGSNAFDCSCAVFDAMERIYGREALRDVEHYRHLFVTSRDKLKQSKPRDSGA